MIKPNQISFSRLFLLVGLFSAGIFLCSCAQESSLENSLNRLIRRDLFYTKEKNFSQSLDFYGPEKSSSKAPLVVWIHGGAWLGGAKDPCPILFLRHEGFAVASINYRLSSEANHPAQVNDCRDAIRFLRSHAEEFGIDPTRIAVWGHSAGGHLAAMLGVLPDEKDRLSSRVKAAIDFAGPANLVSVRDQAGPNCTIDFKAPDNPVARLMGPKATLAETLAASPVSHVSEDDARFLIVHGQADNVVPWQQSQELYEKQKAASAPTELVLAPNADHGLADPSVWQQALKFLQTNL